MNTIYETIKEQATAMRDQLRAVRRDLHTYAEAGWCEPLDSYIASSGFDTSVYLESMTNMMTCNTIRDKTFFIPFCSYT